MRPDASPQARKTAAYSPEYVEDFSGPRQTPMGADRSLQSNGHCRTGF